MSIERNVEFDLAFRFITETQESIFLTGKAGTGKTTFLKYLRDHTTKHMVVAAPTGVAAINAGGVTLHSLFHLPFHPFIPSSQGKAELLSKLRYGKQKQQLLRKIEILVIDEISMVRCDVLDAIDTILRSVRRRHDIPFGGVQLVCIGDLYQLPPVAQNQEWKMLQEYYNSPFFFDSHAIKEQEPLLIELKTIYRQKEESFVELLNKVRNNQMEPDDFELLHQRYQYGFQPPHEEQYITLTTHNQQADQINQRELNRLLSPAYTYKASIEGDFPENSFPADAELILKEGAQVMFLKNDVLEKKYFNGKIGTVKQLTDNSILVHCVDGDVTVRKETWENIRYSLNRSTEVLEEEVLGEFEQYPLRLAWAVTIHKSQGLTFDKLIIDAAAAFASGQVYVALSRCTSLEGIVLLSKIPPAALISNQQVIDGQKNLTPRNSLAERFAGARQLFTQQLLDVIFSTEEIIHSLKRLEYQIQQHLSQLEQGGTEWLYQFRQKADSITVVADKFLGLTKELLRNESIVEQNEPLQKRISDAAVYFTGQLTELRTQLQHHRLVTEQKEASVPIDEQLHSVALQLHNSLYFLDYCKNHFSVIGFLKHRLQLITPKITISCYASKRSPAETTDASHPELYRILRSWRDAYCEEESIPVYMVANSETLKEICRYLPQTKEDLLLIKGLGKAKVEKWGADVLEMVLDYCGEYHVETNMQELKSVKKKTKEPKPFKAEGSTFDVTLSLYEQGKSVEEIAALRKLSAGTIESHLIKLIENKIIAAEGLVEKEKMNRIQKVISENPEQSGSELKMILGDDYSFFEIRLSRLLLQS